MTPHETNGGDSAPLVVPVDRELRLLWPVAVARSKRKELQGATAGVLIALHYYSDWTTGDDARPGQKLLASLVGVSERTVSDALKRGVATGYVELVKRGGGRGGRGKANVYRLTLPKDEAARLESEARPGKRDDSPEGITSGQSTPLADTSAEVMASGQSECGSELESEMTGSTGRMTGSHDFRLPTNSTYQKEKKGSPSRGTSLTRVGAREEEPPTPSSPDPVERPLTRDADDVEMPALRRVEDAMPGGLTAAERKIAVSELKKNGDRPYPVIAKLRQDRDKARQEKLNAREQLDAVARRRTMSPSTNQDEADTAASKRREMRLKAEAELNEVRKAPAPPPPATDDRLTTLSEPARLHDPFPRNFMETAPCPADPNPVPVF
ncbi:helix-turn-helix domain-containing protein [Prescottella equi]|uniref:helix-turn-helix domain-containing protein n=1 Tax=Rhodococcus hoagii TaxID=43767 RepID=UPI001C793BD3|nr:helix-turn-helix domain-containing protein [Prescottella equi]BCN44692.1 hypothetical protein RE9414_29720 [Prescottella equi]